MAKSQAWHQRYLGYSLDWCTIQSAMKFCTRCWDQNFDFFLKKKEWQGKTALLPCETELDKLGFEISGFSLIKIRVLTPRLDAETCGGLNEPSRDSVSCISRKLFPLSRFNNMARAQFFLVTLLFWGKNRNFSPNILCRIYCWSNGASVKAVAWVSLASCLTFCHFLPQKSWLIWFCLIPLGSSHSPKPYVPHIALLL